MRSSVSSWCAYYSTLVLPLGGNERAQTALMYEVTRATYSSVLCALLFLIVAIVGIGKIYIGGFSSYISFFTNWAWSLYGLYYLMASLGHLMWPPALRISIFFLTMCVNGTTWSVITIVLIIIYNNSSIVLDMMSGLGGDTAPGLVLVMNCVFHPLTAPMFLVFAISHTREIRGTFYDVKKALLLWLKSKEMGEPAWWQSISNDSLMASVTISGLKRSYAAVSICMDLLLIYSPMVMLGIYMIFYDPTEVYSYPVMNPETGLLVFVICTFCNGVPYVIVSYGPMVNEPETCAVCGVGHPAHAVDLSFMSLPQVIDRMKDGSPVGRDKKDVEQLMDLEAGGASTKEETRQRTFDSQSPAPFHPQTPTKSFMQSTYPNVRMFVMDNSKVI